MKHCRGCNELGLDEISIENEEYIGINEEYVETKEGYIETKEAKRVVRNKRKRYWYRIASILFPILVLLTYLVVWITGWHLHFVVFVLLLLIFVFFGIEHWCNRCPHCESFLSRSPFFATNCPYCGKHL